MENVYYDMKRVGPASVSWPEGFAVRWLCEGLPLRMECVSDFIVDFHDKSKGSFPGWGG